MVAAGDLFTSFFKGTSITSDCSQTCNLFEAETNEAPGLLALPTSTDYKYSKAYVEYSIGLPPSYG